MDPFIILILAFFILILVICLLARREVARMASPGRITAQPPSSSTQERDIQSLITPFMRPAILLEKKGDDESPTITASSYFGDTPPQYPGFIWPQHQGRALGFLACIDLAALPHAFDWLPRAGHLLFFYDMEETPWGDAADAGGWAVLHTTNPIDATTPKATAPTNLSSDSKVQYSGINFLLANLPPHYDEEAIAHLQLSSAESDELMELRQDLTESPHQIGGYPDPIQNHDMPVECATAVILLNNADVAKLEKPAPDDVKQWQLLFQMASDDDLGIMWGDAGMLYFYVREDDAKQGDFSKVWLIMQSC